MSWRVLIGAVILGASLLVLLFALEQRLPPPLTPLAQRSVSVVDSQGALLRVFAIPADNATGYGALRLKTTPAEVDPLYVQMLIAFEDRRFWQHPGVDGLAMLRATGQWLTHGRIISGGSTLTMQLARLLEPRPRTLPAKCIEMARAVQLERRYTKEEILGFYLTLAPFGGALEGARVASLAYFGKEPKRLTPAQAALLVALPQAPSRLRPDRYPQRARQARDKVLQRMMQAGVINPQQLHEALQEPIPTQRHPLPFYAPHASELARRQQPQAEVLHTTLHAPLQRRVEILVHDYATRLEPGASLAVLVAEHGHPVKIRAYVGSSDYFNSRHQGAVDMVQAVRSPGSALKPFIYALAFDNHLAHPYTQVNDIPRHFGRYAPTNFDGQYRGQISLSEALRHSLNIPAVALLERLGPRYFLQRLESLGTPLRLPAQAQPGLAMALGGVGISLAHLTQLYAGLAQGGQVSPLTLQAETSPSQPALNWVSAQAAWQVSDILRTTPPPGAYGARLAYVQGAVAFKTGTSYGFRDAWAMGFDARYTLGVWVGKPDGTPRPGVDGRQGAAPLLFALFDLLPADPARALRPPAALANDPWAYITTPDALPIAWQRLEGNPQRHSPVPALQLLFPPDGAELELTGRHATPLSLPLHAKGGQPPYRWLINGLPLPPHSRAWTPDGPGYADITVLDQHGTTRHATVWLMP